MAPAQLPETNHVLLSIPEPYVLVVVMNRPQQMNALPVDACWEMDKVWGWFDSMADLYAILLLISPSSTPVPSHIPTHWAYA